MDDVAQVEFLGLCSSLASLSLSGNPVELAPHPNTSEKVHIELVVFWQTANIANTKGVSTFQ